MKKEKIFVLWECQDCRSRGRTQEGYYISCDGAKCNTNSFRVLAILKEEDKTEEV